MGLYRQYLFLFFTITSICITAGCVRYSFTGTSIPQDVQTIYIPFFGDQSTGGIGGLNERLNRALVNRFVNQSRLSLTSAEENADALITGVIQRYQSSPFSVSGDEQGNLNQVQITVQASFRYAADEEPMWNKSFSGSATYNVVENPVDGEVEAAESAMLQIADNMFNDAVSDW